MMIFYAILTATLAVLALIYVWFESRNMVVPAQLARSERRNTGVLIHNLPAEMFDRTEVLCEVRISTHLFDNLETKLQGGVVVTGRKNIPIYEVMDVTLMSPDGLHDIEEQIAKPRVVIDKDDDGNNDYFASWIWRIKAQKPGKSKFLISYAPIINGAQGIPDRVEVETMVLTNYGLKLRKVLEVAAIAAIGALLSKALEVLL